MERAGMLVPKWRVHFPDDISRRWWRENHSYAGEMILPVASDGPQLVNARQFDKAMYQWSSRQVYKQSEHPLDNLDSKYNEFAHHPAERPFTPWSDYRVDVSCERYPKLCDTPLWNQTLYESWQVLLFCEIRSLGFHTHLNLMDNEVSSEARKIYRERGNAFSLKNSYTTFQFGEVASAHGLLKYKEVLAGLNQFSEERSQAFFLATEYATERRLMTEEEQELYTSGRRAAAKQAVDYYQLKSEDVVEAIKFLSKQWADHNRNDHSLIAAEYKEYIGSAIALLRLKWGLQFSDVRDCVGRKGGYFDPILDIIFPSWVDQESKHLEQDIVAIGKRAGFSEELNDAIAKDFVAWLQENGHEGLLWKIHSCNNLIFENLDIGLGGIASEIQGLAVSVENIIQHLGVGGKSSLWNVLKKIWKNHSVAQLLKKKRSLTQRNPDTLRADLTELFEFSTQSPAARIACSLLLTMRVRNASHNTLNIDQIDAEQVISELIIAPVLTFHHIRESRKFGIDQDGRETNGVD